MEFNDHLPKKSPRNRAGIYLGVLLVVMGGMANAHEERPPIEPDGTGDRRRARRMNS